MDPTKANEIPGTEIYESFLHARSHLKSPSELVCLRDVMGVPSGNNSSGALECQVLADTLGDIPEAKEACDHLADLDYRVRFLARIEEVYHLPTSRL